MAVLLGRTSAGVVTDFNGASHAACWPFVASASGQLVVIKGQTGQANADAGAVSMGIYADSAGSPGTRLAGPVAVDNLAAAQGTGVFQATLVTPVAIVSGTTYWLGWRGTVANWDFQGTTATGYKENSGTVDFPDPFGATSNGTVDAILWGEDSGAGPPRTFNPIPFMR